MRKIRVARLPPRVLSHLSYCARSGAFSYRGESVPTILCKRDGLFLCIGVYEAPAHRHAYICNGVNLDGVVVTHLDGDKSNVVASNLVALERSDFTRYGFFCRQLMRSRRSGAVEFATRELTDLLGQYECDATVVVNRCLGVRESS